MNWVNFIRLIRTIYGPGLPDLDFIRRQGLLAVKIGQTYALRADFLREESCRHLATLYRHTDRVPAYTLDQLLATRTNAAWRARFAHIEEQPLASASVGQVHRGRLTTGEAVAVKLIKDDFRERFIRDVASLRRLVKFVTFFYPTLHRVADPLGILETIESGTLAELDLRQEIQGQKRLQAVYDRYKGKFDLSRMRVPRIYEDLSGEQVMVSEFIDGPTFDELLEQGKLPYETLLDLFHIHGFFVFCIGTFHGDIHPGNILLRDGGIYFLDTGAISTVSVKMRQGLFSFFEKLSWYDYEGSAHFLNKMAVREIAGADYEKFRLRFLDLYRDFTGSTVSRVSLTRRMMETIKLGVQCGMVFEKGMYPIIKSLMYLDGMVLRCNPQAELMKDMRRFIGDFKPAVLE